MIKAERLCEFFKTVSLANELSTFLLIGTVGVVENTSWKFVQRILKVSTEAQIFLVVFAFTHRTSASSPALRLGIDHSGLDGVSPPLNEEFAAVTDRRYISWITPSQSTCDLPTPP